MGKGTQKTTETTAPPNNVNKRYNNLLKRAERVSKRPWKNYPGEFTAPINSTMQSAVDAFNRPSEYMPQAESYYQQVATPSQYSTNAASLIDRATGQNKYYDSAEDYLQQSTRDVSPMAFSEDAMSQYMSPYQKQVIDATMANVAEQERRQQQDVIGNSITRGAWGGDRSAVAQAELGRTQELARNQTVADLNNQNYSQALGMFNQQQGVDLQSQLANRQAEAAAAGQYGQMGTSWANNLMAGAGQYGNLEQLRNQGLLGAGAGMLELESSQQDRNAQQWTAGLGLQDIAQKDVDAQYQQWLNKRAYPFQSTSFYSGILQGSAPNMGSTTTTEQPAPNWLSQAIGTGLGAYAMFKGKARGGRVNYAPGGVAASRVPPGLFDPSLEEAPFTPIDPNNLPTGFAEPVGDSGVVNPMDAVVNEVKDTAPKIDTGTGTKPTPPAGVTEYAETGLPEGGVPAPYDPTATGLDPKEETWANLGNLGWGMAAGESPYFFGNVGKGGLYASQAQAARRKDFAEQQQARDKLALDAKIADADRRYKEGMITLGNRNAQIEADKIAYDLKYGKGETEQAYNRYREEELAAGRVPKSETEWRKEIAQAGVTPPENYGKKKREELASEREDVALKAGRTAYNDLGRVDLLEDSLGNIETGAFAPYEGRLVDWALAGGLSPELIESAGLNPNMAWSTQAAEALTGEFLVNMIGEGAFPANNFSEADREFIKAMLPSIKNRPEANKILLEVMRRQGQLKVDHYNALNEWRVNNPDSSYADFERQWAEELRNRFGRGKSMYADLYDDVAALSKEPPIVVPGTETPADTGSVVGDGYTTSD